ncbi:MAG: 2-oxo acid dehydrogenase subunit E2, partial [Clostridia bacterium]|nr:2-oxo acid dehydrogenase subunit E2 [Clostridia bacterium]
MANLVLMPQMGISEESAILTQWHVREGDPINAGDTLFSIETGKSSFDVPSDFTGTLLKQIVPEGEEALIKTPVCAIGEAGESYEAAPSAAPAQATVISPAPRAAPTALQAEPAPYAGSDGPRRVAVSPRARTLAAKADIDPALATPTGPEGRVIERDIRTLLEHGVQHTATPAPVTPVPHAASAAAYEDRPMSYLRKIIAKNMMTSLAQTAQLTHTASFDATGILAYRSLLKEDPLTSGVTLTDMVLYAVTRTLPAFPELNAWVLEDGGVLRYFSEVNLACAVDTEKGLMVPVIFGASGLSLLRISQALKELAEGCRAGNA